MSDLSTARKVLMIIACILSILSLLGFAFLSFTLLISIGNEEALRRMLDGLNRPTMSLKDGKVFVITLSVVFLVFAFFGLINASLAIKGKDSNKKGLMVLNIIFGVISNIFVNILGGIFGLLDKKRVN